MNQDHGQESKTEGIWGAEEECGVRPNANCREDAERASQGTGTECLTPDRENSAERNRHTNPIGGILDQLIDDARKQLGKARECVVWYQSEVKEYEQKLQTFVELKKVQEEQDRQDTEKKEDF
ncbi:hypothetical protein [Microcoleus sp. bin38.metabat.b11b12b14.051]|uniref:hypothetical protein n=1 Tax=Microcoleus sp. bin38.metabat.b11b12b14.051 TaxID=2742709 RepID=UPI0025EBAE99|nr:hypothetical protein [Microcoleus sp. bin38.metabat.b11b12b14.051]